MKYDKNKSIKTIFQVYNNMMSTTTDKNNNNSKRVTKFWIL